MFSEARAWYRRHLLGPTYLRVRFVGEKTTHYREFGLMHVTLCGRATNDPKDPIGKLVSKDGALVCQSCRRLAIDGVLTHYKDPGHSCPVCRAYGLEVTEMGGIKRVSDEPASAKQTLLPLRQAPSRRA